MKKFLFAFVFIAFLVSADDALASKYKVGIKFENEEQVGDFSLCDDENGLCQFSMNLENGDVVDIEVRFKDIGRINFMFSHDGGYLRVGRDREEDYDLVIDQYYMTERKIDLYYPPSEGGEEFMGIKMPEPAAGNEQPLAKFSIIVKPVRY